MLPEKVAAADTELTETVQHRVSESAGPQDRAPVLHSVPVQLPAPASQQWFADLNDISYGVSRCCSLAGVVIVAWVGWRPNLI